MTPWGPREIGILIGQVFLIIIGGWHVNRQSTRQILDKISALAGRLLTVEDTLQELQRDNYSIRDRASRTESRVDMLYIIIGRSSSDPYPDSEEERRRRTSNMGPRRRRSDYPKPPRESEDD